MTSENWRVNESGRYLPSGAVGQPPQLVQPAVGSLDGQNRHCHAVGTKHRSLTPYCRILIFLPHSALHHFNTRLIDLFPPRLLNTGEADPPLIGSVFPQILVEDGGRQEGSSVVVFHLQVPQVRVGLPICTDNHLGDQQG